MDRRTTQEGSGVGRFSHHGAQCARLSSAGFIYVFTHLAILNRSYPDVNTAYWGEDLAQRCAGQIAASAAAALLTAVISHSYCIIGVWVQLLWHYGSL